MNFSEFRKHNKLGYFWASLQTPFGGNFDAGLATSCDPRPIGRVLQYNTRSPEMSPCYTLCAGMRSPHFCGTPTPAFKIPRLRLREEASILWSRHEETRELPGDRGNARNNDRCTQARKTTHGLDGQHEYVDRTPRGRLNQNVRGQR